MIFHNAHAENGRALSFIRALRVLHGPGHSRRRLRTRAAILRRVRAVRGVPAAERVLHVR